MKRFFAILFLVCGFSAGAATQEQVTALVTLTNLPTSVPTNTFTVNGNTRTWTNTTTASPATLIATNATINGSATNLYFQIASARYSGPVNLIFTSTNSISLIGAVGQTMVLSRVGDWCSISYSTNFVTNAIAVRVPMSVENGTNRNFIASELVQGIGLSSTSAFPATATALTNFVNLAESQTIGNKRLTNSVFNSPLMTNGSNFGNAFVSYGPSGIASLQLGLGATATNDYSTAVGPSSDADGYAGFAGGYLASAGGEASTSVGTGSDSSGILSSSFGYYATSPGESSTAVGASSTAGGINSGAFGVAASAPFNDSISIGNGVSTTRTNQIKIGTLTQTVDIAKLFVLTSMEGTNVGIWGGSVTNITAAISTATVTNLYGNAVNVATLSVTNSATLTNATIRGLDSTNAVFRGTNINSGDLSFTRLNITTLANGANPGINTGTNVYLKVSGPTAAYSIQGLAGGRDGRILIIQKTDSYTMSVACEGGAIGNDPTDSNRILTGTGADITITNNPGFVELIYDGATSRWGVRNKSN